jgi:hypothetical protein
MDKICNSDDSAEWKLHFELQQGNPLKPVVKLDVDLNKKNNQQAEDTAKDGLNDTQQGQAKIAAAVAGNPKASDNVKKAAVGQIISSRTA